MTSENRLPTKAETKAARKANRQAERDANPEKLKRFQITVLIFSILSWVPYVLSLLGVSLGSIIGFISMSVPQHSTSTSNPFEDFIATMALAFVVTALVLMVVAGICIGLTVTTVVLGIQLLKHREKPNAKAIAIFALASSGLQLIFILGIIALPALQIYSQN